VSARARRLLLAQPFVLKTRQPWADKEVEPVELTEEQKTYMEQVRDGWVGGGRVSRRLHCPLCTASMPCMLAGRPLGVPAGCRLV
jgi:hypothetical protein